MANINEVMQALLTLSSHSALGPDTEVVLWDQDLDEEINFPIPTLAHTEKDPIVRINIYGEPLT